MELLIDTYGSFQFVNARLNLLIHPAFNDVAEHDIVWGERSVPYSNMSERDDNDYIEWCLSFGLEWLHKVVTASTYDERYQMFLPNLSTNHDFIVPILYHMDTLPLPALDSFEAFDDRTLGALSEEDQLKILSAQFADESDRGPLKVWHWAYQDSKVAKLYYGLEQEKLRERGYVMYDFDRLCRWNVFSAPFDLQQAYEDWFNRRREKDGLFERMMESWTARSNVWLRGGRGWWRDGDESKLIWVYAK